MVETPYTEPGLFPQTVGERLRSAREAAGMDLNDVAMRTRVPLRHLEAIEKSDYSALPSQTYAIGFVRAYARAIGTDDVSFARELRAELGREEPGETDSEPYEPADPARVPPRILAWTAAILALVLVIAYGVWRSEWLSDKEPAATPVVAEAPDNASETPDNAIASAPAPSATGQVVLTATAPVWLRIYDKDRKRLFEKEMATGETYQVPADANGPMILTGRPDALKVTVDGNLVPPLGAPQNTIKDVGISASALAARSPMLSVPPPAAAPPVATAPPATAPLNIAAPSVAGNSTN